MTKLKQREIWPDAELIIARVQQFYGRRPGWVSFTAWVFATFGSECKSFTSTRNVLADTTITETGNLRQWMWQSCTQFGYFQIAPTEGFSVRPLELDLAYNLELCDAAFGDGFRPDIEGTNARYGGLGLAGTRIYPHSTLIQPPFTGRHAHLPAERERGPMDGSGRRELDREPLHRRGGDRGHEPLRRPCGVEP